MNLDAVGLEAARAILEPGLFDAAFYAREAGLEPGADAFAHFWTQGAARGLRANAVFDADYYLAQNPGVAPARALLHYAQIGEAADRNPSALFDVGWYRAAYRVERPLAHYLGHRFGPFSPIPEFDSAFYLAQYPDVAAARLDPFLHYLHFGFREFRKPRAGFNPRLYALRHMAGDFATNPVAHMRAHPDAPAAPPRIGPYEEARRFGRRGPRYEPRDLAEGEPRALLLAFHLPQFHRTPENDAWWGEGFTEWTQIARGLPRFAGHYQPRIPGALGFYDLTNVEALRAQARLARQAGIGALVFYHYDFDGRRLLEKPVDLFLATPDIDMPFCLMWANENWTRRWDGAEHEVLIAQTYERAAEAARIAGFVRHFRDPRYLRLEGRPLLMVYRAGLIPDTASSLARWRRLFAQSGENPILVMAQTFDDLDPRPLGFDAAIEFPPHKLTKGLPQVYDRLDIFDEGFEADAFAYDDLVDASLSEPAPAFPLIRTAVPSWDNDARRGGKGLTLVGSTPRAYEIWLSELVERAAPLFGARLVAVNAWNEWSEGAYLEPDVHFGHAYLNATARAVRGAAGRKAGADRAAAPSGAAKASVFVVHRGGPFPHARLRSLFAQTHPVFEIVVLDAAEGAAEAVEREARAAGRDVTLVLDVADPLAQAADMAGGDFVWLVEADGFSDETALAALARALQAEPRAAFAFCQLGAADGQGRRVRERPAPLAASARALVDRVWPGADFVRAGRTPALSATLWRRGALRSALADRALPFARAALAPHALVYEIAERLEFARGL